MQESRIGRSQMMYKGRPSGRLYEGKFGYNSKMEGHMTLMSDITELYAMQEEEILG